MKSKKIVAMLLAGGQGSRLGVLTSSTAKPAVPYGGKYRIIDFPLSNCTNSGIDTVGVLTQYRPMELNSYIGNGAPWDLNRSHGGVYVLPPYATGDVGEWYLGTANAIYQNVPFLDLYKPKYVMVLSGDHIYKMDYGRMLAAHEENEAECTIAVLPVDISEASRFGIMDCDENNRILSFEEKPEEPKSNLASMGVYIFTWDRLQAYLEADEKSKQTHHDFGKDIIPAMLDDGCALYAYPFRGYWKDVGTVYSLWESNMDLLEDPPRFNLYDPSWRIYSRNPIMPPHYVADSAMVARAIVTEGAEIYGTVNHSVIFAGVTVEEGALVVDSVIMPGTVIKKGARVMRAIVGEQAVIGENATIGKLPEGAGGEEDITVLGDHVSILPGSTVKVGSVVRNGEDIF